MKPALALLGPFQSRQLLATGFDYSGPPCLVLCAGTTTYEWYPRDLLLGLAGDLPRSLNHHFKTVYKPRCWLLKTSTDGNETGHSMT